jgi:GNAT superfamily N-acetyltransferase
VDVRLHRSVDEFRAIAEPLYRRDSVLHTIELTLLRGGEFGTDSLLLTVWDDGAPIGSALQTPPYPLVCTGIPAEGIESVVRRLAETHPKLDGVRGVRDKAVAFADAWRAVAGRAVDITVEERLYRLGTLRAPSGVAGSYRLGTDDDRAVLVDWVELFFGETFGHPRNTAEGATFVDAAKDRRDRFILWTVDGIPVSMAMLRAPAAGVSRIGPVFTPVTERSHGYGSAVTAAAAAEAHRSGTSDVVLFADLANPVSNSIYQRIGFEPVVESVRIDFGTVD